MIYIAKLKIGIIIIAPLGPYWHHTSLAYHKPKDKIKGAD